MADELHAIRTIRRARLERRLRRKALVEGLLLLAAGIAAFAAAFTLAPGMKQALLLPLAVACIGLPLFFVRRGQDLRLLARADDWRVRALDGRGISLADWHGGTDLPAWTDRR